MTQTILLSNYFFLCVVNRYALHLLVNFPTSIRFLSHTLLTVPYTHLECFSLVFPLPLVRRLYEYLICCVKCSPMCMFIWFVYSFWKRTASQYASAKRWPCKESICIMYILRITASITIQNATQSNHFKCLCLCVS